MYQDETLEGRLYDPRVGYVSRHNHARLSPLSYSQPHSYKQRREKEKRDTLKFVPWTNVKKFPRSGNEGLYGFTYRLSGIINMREGELNPYEKLNTDVHESIHTVDERETRYLTEWIIAGFFPEHEKYDMAPPRYRV